MEGMEYLLTDLFGLNENLTKNTKEMPNKPLGFIILIFIIYYFPASIFIVITSF